MCSMIVLPVDSEGFRHKYTNGIGNRLPRSDQSGVVSATKEQLIMEKRESVKLKESTETNGSPADSFTLTCCACNQQFRVRIGLVSHQRTRQHINI